MRPRARSRSGGCVGLWSRTPRRAFFTYAAGCPGTGDSRSSESRAHRPPRAAGERSGQPAPVGKPPAAHRISQHRDLCMSSVETEPVLLASPPDDQQSRTAGYFCAAAARRPGDEVPPGAKRRSSPRLPRPKLTPAPLPEERVDDLRAPGWYSEIARTSVGERATRSIAERTSRAARVAQSGCRRPGVTGRCDALGCPPRIPCRRTSVTRAKGLAGSVRS